MKERTEKNGGKVHVRQKNKEKSERWSDSKNDNGTVDIGLFQLNDRYIWTEFREKYWFDNVELDPFNWKHNTYIALHLMADLHKEFKVQDDAIMAYNGGRGAVMNGFVKPGTYDYLKKVQNNLFLLKGDN